MKSVVLLIATGLPLLFSACTTNPGPSVEVTEATSTADGSDYATIPESRMVNGTTVGYLFSLPVALENLYGFRKVDFTIADSYTARRKTTPTEWRFVFTHPRNQAGAREMAKAFLLFALDRHYSERLQATDAEKSALADHGSYFLIGQQPPPTDRVYSLWWTLRMDGVEAPTGPIQDGEKVMISMRTYGYKGPGFSPGDFGHATLGVRTIGGDPNDDFMINPGAVTPEGYKGSVSGAFLGDKDVPNKVEIFNMWDWLEAQNTLRYLDIDYRILRVAPEQMEALELIKQEYEKLNWGSFKMLTNNCANGALSIYNLLRRVDLAEQDTKKLGKVIVPEKVLEYATAQFTFAGQITILSEEMPEDMKKTPGADTIELEDRSASVVYRQVVSLEKEEFE